MTFPNSLTTPATISLFSKCESLFLFVNNFVCIISFQVLHMYIQIPHTAKLKMDNQQGPIVQHTELYSKLCASLERREIRYVCVCMAESCCCSPETNTTLLISYTQIKNKKFKAQKKNIEDNSKISKEITEFNNTISQLDTIDIWRLLHPTIAEYTFFSMSYGIFTEENHILGHKIHFKFKRMETMSVIRLH